jgi:HAD superfamily hydrolase (TIGR01457 family)
MSSVPEDSRTPSPSAPPPLADRYDSFLLDLDGVLYRGDEPVGGAPEAVTALRDRSRRVVFITNNSSRTPEQVVEKLAAVGIEADPSEVVTSALATADRLATRGAGTAFVIGEAGIRTALTERGIEVVDGEPERADYVVVGFDRGADYARLRTAALLVQNGASLVATNADASYPAPEGLWPGAGALLAAITTTLGRGADEVIGKPHPALYRAALQSAGGQNPLVVGDRVDTDIAGALPLGWDSLLVFTGVTRPADLLLTDSLPTYMAGDISDVETLPPMARPATPDDVPDLEPLLREAGLETDGVLERIGETICATVDSEVVATASLELFGQIVHLRSVAVEERCRGKHAGTLVVANAARLARERGARELFAVTEGAAGFFERLGFERIGTKADLPDAIAATPMVRDQCSTDSVALRIALG